jgi:hypothetical protein
MLILRKRLISTIKVGIDTNDYHDLYLVFRFTLKLKAIIFTS